MTDNFYPPPPHYPPQQPKSRAKIALRIASIVIGAAGFGVAVTVLILDDDNPKPKTHTSASATATDEPFADFTTEEETAAYDTVDASSFTIELRTTERQCFGSAGCNVTVEPELTYLGESDNIDPDATYEITYEIDGDDSGPVIETITLTNQTSMSYQETYLSTASSGTEVTAEITSVIER